MGAQLLGAARLRKLSRRYALPFTRGWGHGGYTYDLRAGARRGHTHYVYDLKTGVLTGPLGCGRFPYASCREELPK